MPRRTREPKMTVETLMLRDMPQYLSDALVNDVRHSAACFLVLGNDANEPPQQCGSGTFVKHGNTYGILTAAHVIRALRKFDYWFIVMPRGGRAIRIAKSSVAYIFTDAPTVEADGPDIGFIRFAAHVASHVKSVYSFINLANHQARLADNVLEWDDGVWVQVGYPVELGARHTDLSSHVVGVFCLGATGGINETRERDGFDYYDGHVKYDGTQENVPSTFRGMSGGGLWFMRLLKRKKRFEIRDRFLSGVVFYEIAHEGKVSSIRSHGRKSVYEYALTHLVNGQGT